jgi:hypothetical protein
MDLVTTELVVEVEHIVAQVELSLVVELVVHRENRYLPSFL